MNRSEAGFLGALKTKQLWLSRYDASPKYCTQCSIKLLYKKRHNKFCNQSCAAVFNNLLKHPPKLCLFCNKIIRSRDAYARKYCSGKCMRDYEFQEICKIVKETGKIPLKHVAARKFLIRVRGAKCEACNVAEWMGKKLPMILDHINGDSEDFSVLNLRLICSNCDSVSDTYKSKNRGNGRYSRRKRYAEGKSY